MFGFGYSSYAARYVTRMLLLVFASISSLMSSLNNLSSLSNQSQKRDEDVEQLIGTLDEQSKALQNIQGTLDSGFGSATKHRNENKEEVKTHVTEQLEKFRQEMIERQAETDRKRQQDHQESLALMKTAMTGGKTLNFESNDAPAERSDNHLGKDIVVADEETTTATEQSGYSSTAPKSITANESLPDATKEEAVDLEVKSGVQQASSQSIVDSPLLTNATPKKDLNVKLEKRLATAPTAKNEANNFNDVEVKVEKQLETAPRTPGPRDFTFRDTAPTSTTRAAKKDQRPPLSDRKATSTRKRDAAEMTHVDRRKKGRMQESAALEAKRVNVNFEQSFQTRRHTRSASKKGSR